MQVSGLSCSTAACLFLLIWTSNQQAAHQGLCYVLDLHGSSTRFGRAVEEFHCDCLQPFFTFLWTAAAVCWMCAVAVYSNVQNCWVGLPTFCSWGAAIDLDLTAHFSHLLSLNGEKSEQVHAMLPFLTPDRKVIGQDVCLALELGSCQPASLPSQCACADNKGAHTD